MCPKPLDIVLSQSIDNLNPPEIPSETFPNCHCKRYLCVLWLCNDSNDSNPYQHANSVDHSCSVRSGSNVYGSVTVLCERRANVQQ
jgi:hypothetical protein